MLNGSSCNEHDLIEFIRIGLIHSPSGRLLTSETFQGSLNVSGTSLKRKQIWTLYTESKDPNVFFLQNHLGTFLSVDNNGKVTLVSEELGSNERFIIHFDRQASGEVAFQSEKSGLYLQWTGAEMRCFSKEPVWWGMRLAIHPQIHLYSVHRSCFIRSANKESRLRAVTKMPCSSKFLLWLQQLPLSVTADNSSKDKIARLSRVTLCTHSGLYLRSDGSLVGSIEEATLFAVSFKPGESQVLMFRDEQGDYLTVGAGGVLKTKTGAREPRKEEFFSVETPSNYVRIWAANKKFACDKRGLTFFTTLKDTEDQNSTLYALEYVGGRGLDVKAIVNNAVTPSADTAQPIFSFDGAEEGAAYITTGLWRLRSQDRRLWRIPPTGSADLAPSDCTEHTAFEILHFPSCMDDETEGRMNPRGGVVLRTLDCLTACVKALGMIGTADRRADSAAWLPSPTEVLHLLPLINRSSIACYSPLSCCFLGAASSSTTARRPSHGGGSVVECSSSVPQQWFLLHLVAGTVQLFTKQADRWLILSVTTQGGVNLTESLMGPNDLEADIKSSLETEFVISMISNKYALLRAILPMMGGRPGFLCTNPQGSVKLDVSGAITSGCIWQI